MAKTTSNADAWVRGWLRGFLHVGVALSVLTLFALVPGCPSAGGGGGGGGEDECVIDADCDAGEVCEDGECVPAPECEGDADCDDGDLCTDDQCVDGECEHLPVVCEEGEVCDPATGECVVQECETDADCEEGEVCQDGLCVMEAECETDADCEEGEVCEDGMCVAAPECETDADCEEGEVCEDGMCVAAPECETDADCEEGEVCEDGMCVAAPECETDADCEEGEVCEDGMCVAAPECETDADCDAGEQCVDGECVVVTDEGIADANPGVDFGGLTDGTGVDLTAPVATTPLQPTIADCTCAWSVDGNGTFSDAASCTTTYTPGATDMLLSVTVTCTDPDTADQFEDTFTQAVMVACVADADCDDGLFCTGTETCGTDGLCVAGTDPCAEGDTCDEDADACVTPGGDFTLTTEDDAISGTSGNDTFVAAVGTLNPGDIVVGNGGDDVLNAVVAGATSSEAALIDIDTVNFDTLNGVTFDALNSAAIGQYNVVEGSSGDLTLDNVEDGAGFGLGADYDGLLTVTLDNDAGTDEADLEVNGTDEAAFDYVQDADPLETLNVMIMADSSLTPADPGTDLFGDVDDADFSGTGNLTLMDVDETDTAANSPDFEDFEGELTIAVVADAGATWDFTAGGLADIDDLNTYIIQDTQTFNHQLTLDATDNDLTVQIMDIDEDDLAGNLTVIRNGGQDDNLLVELGGDGDGMGALAAATTEFITIMSGGTSGNTINNITGESGTPFLNEEVTIEGDQDLDAGNVTSEILDASAFTGALTATLVSTGGSGMQATSGTGDDTLTGSDQADLIDGGEGDDILRGAAGADTITGGAGADDFILNHAATTDGITDFSTDGPDEFLFDLTDLEAAAAGGIRPANATDFVELNDGSSVSAGQASGVQELSGADTADADATVFVLTGATFADAAAVQTALEVGGSRALSGIAAGVVQYDAFIVVYADTGGFVVVAAAYMDTETADDGDFEANDLTVVPLARLEGYTAIGAGDFAAAMFEFID